MLKKVHAYTPKPEVCITEDPGHMIRFEGERLLAKNTLAESGTKCLALLEGKDYSPRQ